MSGRSEITPAQTRDRARAALRSRLRSWLADPIAAQSDRLDVALKPPTERSLSADPDAAREWVRTWQRYSGPGMVDWEPRRWPSFGTQDVPVRLSLTGAADIARAAGEFARWQRLADRRDTLVTLSADEGFAAAIAGTSTRWDALDDSDFQRLIATTAWLLAHPDSGLLIRQLPIEGVDTKWLGSHRKLVEKLVAGARGSTDLGIRPLPVLREIALLDRALRPGMPSVFAASDADLADLSISPARVLILENREGLYALPPTADTVAVHGCGYDVTDLARIGWLSAADVVYWGDLDTHGMAILDRLRRLIPHTRSILMDPGTLTTFKHLSVTEPSPTDEETVTLTDDEYDALSMIRAGTLRLEQERIPWPYVIERLTADGHTPPAA